MGSHWTKGKGPGELASPLTERMKNERSRVVNEPVMETEQRALEYGRRFSGQVEVMAVESSFTPVSFGAEKLKQVETGESWGLGVRIVVNGRIGSSSTNDPEDVEGLVGRAV